MEKVSDVQLACQYRWKGDIKGYTIKRSWRWKYWFAGHGIPDPISNIRTSSACRLNPVLSSSWFIKHSFRSVGLSSVKNSEYNIHPRSSSFLFLKPMWKSHTKSNLLLQCYRYIGRNVPRKWSEISQDEPLSELQHCNENEQVLAVSVLFSESLDSADGWASVALTISLSSYCPTLLFYTALY